MIFLETKKACCFYHHAIVQHFSMYIYWYKAVTYLSSYIPAFSIRPSAIYLSFSIQIWIYLQLRSFIVSPVFFPRLDILYDRWKKIKIIYIKQSTHRFQKTAIHYIFLRESCETLTWLLRGFLRRSGSIDQHWEKPSLT